jgi:hypothetical protein
VSKSAVMVVGTPSQESMAMQTEAFTFRGQQLKYDQNYPSLGILSSVLRERKKECIKRKLTGHQRQRHSRHYKQRGTSPKSTSLRVVVGQS